MDIEEFKYPFSFLGTEDYEWEEIYCPLIPGERPDDLSLIDVDVEEIKFFHKNIKDVLFIRPGENDEISWQLVAKLKNNVYIFYVASCDYTGFDCRGGMRIYASYSFDFLMTTLSDKQKKDLGVPRHSATMGQYFDIPIDEIYQSDGKIKEHRAQQINN